MAASTPLIPEAAPLIAQAHGIAEASIRRIPEANGTPIRSPNASSGTIASDSRAGSDHGNPIWTSVGKMATLSASKTTRTARVALNGIRVERRLPRPCVGLQAEKMKQLNLAGFSNIEIAEFLQTTPAVVAQLLYMSKRSGKKRG